MLTLFLYCLSFVLSNIIHAKQLLGPSVNDVVMWKHSQILHHDVTRIENLQFNDEANLSTSLSGYVVYQYSMGASCNSTKTYSTGVAAGTCISNSGTSYKIFIGNDACTQLQYSQYSDDLCQTKSFDSPLTNFTECSMYMPDTYLSSVRGYCDLSPDSLTLQMNSTLYSVYQSDDTCSYAPVGFSAYADDVCLDVFGGSSGANLTESMLFTCNASMNMTTKLTYNTSASCDASPAGYGPSGASEETPEGCRPTMTTGLGGASRQTHAHDHIYVAPGVSSASVLAARPSLRGSGVEVLDVNSTSSPSVAPSSDVLISLEPSVSPSAAPTSSPTTPPSVAPTQSPTSEIVTPSPTETPISGSSTPTEMPSVAPSATPSATPSTAPSVVPSVSPTVSPSASPSVTPSAAPSVAPSVTPTTAPSAAPSVAPSQPTEAPSTAPSSAPITGSVSPSVSPSTAPTVWPTAAPSSLSDAPSTAPVAATASPSAAPSVAPFAVESSAPSAAPVFVSDAPSVAPTASSSLLPSDDFHGPADDFWTNAYLKTSCATANVPIVFSTHIPTAMPSAYPSVSSAPSAAPVTVSAAPSTAPSSAPVTVVTTAPSVSPSGMPVAPGSPTIAPSAVPTAAPSANNLVIFTATQVLTGISYTEYQADTTLYDQTLRETIATCMTGVVYTDIDPFTVSDPAASRRLGVTLRVLQSTTNTVNMAYTVTTNSAGVTYAGMTSQLDAATSGTAFTTNLNSYAATNGATQLQGCTSSVPVTVNTTPSSSSSDDDSLSGGAVAGIVIGVLAFVAIVIAAAYYFMFSGGSGGDRSNSSSGSKNNQHSLSKDSTGSNNSSGASYQKKKAPMQENPVFGISAIASPNKRHGAGTPMSTTRTCKRRVSQCTSCAQFCHVL